MFAVIRTGGKQYKVAEGDVIYVETLAGSAGDTLTLDDVLAVGKDGAVTLGTPTVKGASVQARILGQDRAEKVIIFKKRRRHNYRRKKGHKQHITVLKVTGIKAA